MNGPYFGPCTTIRQYRDRDQSIQDEHGAELEAAREADSFSFGPRQVRFDTSLTKEKSMRFYINGRFRDGSVEPVEVLGEECSFPNTGDERFAVHHNILPRDDDEPNFAVSHIETGFLVASGETIADAIELAWTKLAAKGPDELQKAIEKAREELAAANLGSVN